MSKIKNNPSYNKLRQDIEGAKSLRKVLKIASAFSSKVQESVKTLDKMIAMESELEHIASMPDKFNEHFSSLGWIAHETMSSTVMEQTVELAEKGMISEAESILVEYYCSEQTAYNVHWLKKIPAFLERYELISYARVDTIEERYYSCIPLLLMIIDGSVNDIDRSKGFFTDGSDLTAWDSIAAHSTGLSVIRGIFNKSIKKTRKKQITIPYRNGILHGREIGYANKIVAAKCWAALFAIYDWAVKIKSGKKYAPESEPEITWAQLRLQQKELRWQKKQIENWKPRTVVIGVDIPEAGDISEYKLHTPEKSAIEFVTYWKQKNYGFIAKLLELPYNGIRKHNEIIKDVKRVLEDKKLIDYQIMCVDDQAPAICEIKLNLKYEFQSEIIEHNTIVRLICQRQDGSTSMFGDEQGIWFIMDYFLHDIDGNSFKHLINSRKDY